MLKAAPGATARAQTQIPSQIFRHYIAGKEVAKKAPEKASKKAVNAAVKLKIEKNHWHEVDAKAAKQEKADWAMKVGKENAQKEKGNKVIKENALKMKGIAKQKELTQKKTVELKLEKDHHHYTSAKIAAREAVVKKNEGGWHE